MQRNQGSRGTSLYKDWTKPHRDLTPPGGSGLQQQQQAHTHPLGAGGVTGGILPTPPILSQSHVMPIGGRSLLGMIPMYHPSLASAAGLQPHPQSQPQVSSVLHGGGSGGGTSSSSSGGNLRTMVQPKGQMTMMPGHTAAVPVINTALPPAPPQLNIWDVASGTVSLTEVAPPIRKLGFPASAIFVLGNVENYFKSRVIAGKKELIQEKLRNLIGIFIFQQTVDSVSFRGEGIFCDSPGKGGHSSAVEEVELLLALQKRMEEQAETDLRYALFDAIFGGIVEGRGREFDMLCKLVSLCVSLESEGVLLCAAIWLSEHSQGALALASYLFHEFCEMLPDASAPLTKLVFHSPHFAYQLASAITSLQPFHVVGNQHPGVDPLNLQPPLSTLHIISEWVESSPEFLYSTSKHSETIRSKYPLLHSQSSKEPHSPSLQLPITGIIQWCILAPLVKCSAGNGRDTARNGGQETHSNFQKESNTINSRLMLKDDDLLYQEKLARLHAEVLSALLSVSHASSSPESFSPLSSDDVAILVATLLAFSQKQGVAAETKRAKGSKVVVKQEAKDGMFGACSSMVEQCVERFAQFLQISLSTEVLQLKPEDLTSIASTLPKNRLLEVVIAHCTQQLKASQLSNLKGLS